MEERIVPIFLKDNFNGNGIIIDKFLVAPAHVLEISIPFDCYIILDGKRLYLKLKDLICFEKGFSDFGNKKFDLIIFNLEDIKLPNFSPIIISQVDSYTKSFLRGYNGDGKFIQIFNYPVEIIHNYSYFYPINSKPVLLNNVFEFISEENIDHGLSGSSIYKGNELYGILIYAIDNNYVGLSAQYIIQTLSERLNSI